MADYIVAKKISTIALTGGRAFFVPAGFTKGNVMNEAQETNESAEQPDFNAMSQEQCAEAISKLPAYMDHELMYEIESDCQNNAHGVNRRVLLAVLTMDSEKLFEACEKSPEAFFDGFRSSAGTLGNLKRLVRLLDVGHNRLMVGLCGVDFNQPDAPFSEQDFFDALQEAKGEDITDGGAS